MVKEALQRNAVMFDIYEILGGSSRHVADANRVGYERHLPEPRYSITIISLSLDDVDAGTQIEQIIQNKAQAIQQIEIAQKEREKAEVDAQTLDHSKRKPNCRCDADWREKRKPLGFILIANANAEAIKSKLDEVLITLGLDPQRRTEPKPNSKSSSNTWHISNTWLLGMAHCRRS
ncbi:MAG: hypothetical protein MZU97_00205 [Bacillus subtilis]|nr:hypothetical protein [Bacillus subtilis]